MDTKTARIVKPTEIKDCLDVAIKAVRRGQVFLQENQEEVPKMVSREAREVKIDLDFALEKLILNELQENSSWRILSEESSAEIELGKPFWVVDPLDGSLNRLRGIPFNSISIALCDNDEPILGVILDLSQGDLYYGSTALGAWMNEMPIHVSKVGFKGDAILCTGFPSSFDFDSESSDRLGSVYSNFHKVRMFGSAALSLAYVASGRCDSYWEERIKVWDVAAGLALVRAAGGVIVKSKVNDDFILNCKAAAAIELLVDNSDSSKCGSGTII
jgi:myo-inositol-1(or 4)-monophosphatase